LSLLNFTSHFGETVLQMRIHFGGAEMVRISSVNMMGLVGLRLCMLPGGRLWCLVFVHYPSEW